MRLALLGLAWILGVAAAQWLSDPAAAMAAAGLFSAALFAVRPRVESLAIAVLGTLLVFGGAIRYATDTPNPPPVASQNDRGPVTLRGIITDGPDPQGASHVYRFEARERRGAEGWIEESGGILLRTTEFPRYEYGDYLQLSGDLAAPENFNDFDYRAYLLRRGVASLTEYPEVSLVARGQGSAVRGFVRGLRGTLAESIGRALPEPEASLASGVLLGAGSDLPSTLRSDLNVTGTSHIVAVSGQNVTMIAVAVIAALSWFIGRRPAAWTALFVIAGYAAMVGLEPSVLRASIMGSIWILAIIVGRQNTAWVGIAVAAAVMTALEPQIVHDVGFQLSFASTLALSLLGAPLERWLRAVASRWPPAANSGAVNGLILLVSMTMASIAFTVPITLLNFDRISLVAPLANVLVLPAFALVLTTSALLAALGLISGWLADLAAFIAWPPAAYMLLVIDALASVPWASLEISWFSLEHATMYYAALAALVWRLHKSAPRAAGLLDQTAPAGQHIPVAGAVAFGCAVFVAAAAVWLLIGERGAEERLRVTFLDVGQGDAALIETPNGQRVLVDGGPSGEAIELALGRALPFWDRRIDLVVLTHPQSDHLAGLVTVLETYDVGAALSSGIGNDTGAYAAWEEALSRSGTPQLRARAATSVGFGEGVSMVVLNPPHGTDGSDLNQASLVLRLSMGNVSFLLPGDATRAAEARLLASQGDIDATVLKVAHHGSATSSSGAFLDAVSPLLSVISVGAANPFGHPADEVLARLEGGPVLRTDRHGDIVIETDGDRLWAETQRNGPSE